MTHPSLGTAAARALPARPNLEHLKNEAKQRLDTARLTAPRTKLSEVQFQLAREYGFASWRELKAEIDRPAAKPAADPAGDWIASLPEVRVALHVRMTSEGELSATMDSPDYGAFGFSVDTFSVKDDALSLALLHPTVNALYEAKWDDDAHGWAGTWLQNGVSYPLIFRRGAFPPAPTVVGLNGTWEGLLKVKGGLRMIFHIKTSTHGTFAMCDSPDRGGYNFPASSISRQGRNVRIVMKSVRIEGELDDDGQTITAAFIRPDVTLPLTLARRAPGAAALRRPDPPVVGVPSRLLASYAGTYAMSGWTITITVEDGTLYAAFTGQPKREIFASSETEFFSREIERRLTFEADPEGKTTSVIVHMNGRSILAPRVVVPA